MWAKIQFWRYNLIQMYQALCFETFQKKIMPKDQRSWLAKVGQGATWTNVGKTGVFVTMTPSE